MSEQGAVEKLQNENAKLEAQLKWEQEKNKRVSSIATRRAQELEAVKAENDSIVKNYLKLESELFNSNTAYDFALAELAALRSQTSEPVAWMKEGSDELCPASWKVKHPQTKFVKERNIPLYLAAPKEMK